MSKALFNKDELKSKGLDKQKVPYQTKPDHKKREGSEKPLITLNWGDRWNQFSNWFQDVTVSIIEKVASNLIPTWFFIALLGVIILLVVL